jgi:Arc/MetJ-type ribon-helix-helix transcriptional regulator
MTAAKIAITLPQAQVAHIKRIVRAGRAESVSGYIAGALAAQERQETLQGLVADLIAEHGEPTQKETAWAKRAIGQRRRG